MYYQARPCLGGLGCSQRLESHLKRLVEGYVRRYLVEFKML
jgi:hypothetical protein